MNIRKDIKNSEVIALYKKGYSLNEISNKFNCLAPTILYRLKKVKYPCRTIKQEVSLARKKGRGIYERTNEIKNKIRNSLIGKEHTEETKKKMSKSRKGHITSDETKQKLSVAHKCKKFTEEHKKKLSIVRSKLKLIGNRASAWKGGITPLYNLIRNLDESKKLRNQIFQRDNYTCQECFEHGGILHAHHKKEFSLLLQEFLHTYSQFSPIEDKETLLRLSLTYLPFWDLSNGKTLCIKCHKKTDNYLWKNKILINL